MRALILGVTGTLGRAMTKELLGRASTELIRGVSRDELKLSEFKREFSDARVDTAIGDIRDKSSIKDYFKDIDVCFHFAAMKRIPEMERHPLESLKTNVLGTINAAELALENKVRHFVFSSTDKATRPINTYGACKFLSEQMLFNFNQKEITNFSVYRWVNVLASRGAVVYAFKDAIESGIPAHITNENMTRGWIRIEDAVNFVLNTFETHSNEVKIPKFKCAPAIEVLKAIGQVLNKPVDYIVTGMRPGEKLHEDICYNRETGVCLSTDNADQYTGEELLGLARSIVGMT